MNGVLNGAKPNFSPDYGKDNNPKQVYTDTRSISNFSSTVFMGEAVNQPWVTPSLTGNTIDRQRHNGDALNLLFMDGRVALFKDTQVPVPTQINNLWQSDEPLLIWGPFKN